MVMSHLVPRLAGQFSGRLTVREHDACGIAFLANPTQTAAFALIEQALDLQWQMRHRAGINANGLSDGIGLMTDLPQDRFRAFVEGELEQQVHNPNLLAVASVMLPQGNPELAGRAKQLIESAARENGQRILGWRRVPTNYEVLGIAEKTAPAFWQFITEAENPNESHFVQEARAQQLGHRINGLAWQQRLNDAAHPHQVYVANFSTQRLLYKGMTPHGQFDQFFPDLQPGAPLGLVASMASIHVRYSTNTGSINPLAQGFSAVMHNGEINTIMANARRLMEKAGPDYLIPSLSDSAILDMAYSYMVYGQGMLPEVALVSLLQPLSRFKNHEDRLTAARQLRTLMQGGAYNGPANLIVQAPRGELDNTVLLATDNNGMRPSNVVRYGNGLVVYGSEVFAPKGMSERDIVSREVMGKGYLAAFDLKTGALTTEGVFERAMAQAAELTDIGPQTFYSSSAPANGNNSVSNGDLIAAGFHAEYMGTLLSPMAVNGKEPIDAMGRSAPLTAFRQTLSNPYDWVIHQHVQVTAPTLASDIEATDFTNFVTLPNEINLPSPLVINAEAAALKISTQSSAHTIDATYDLEDPNGLETIIDRLAAEAVTAAEAGKQHIWISHRSAGTGRVAVPSLFMIGAVQQALLAKGLRHKVGIYAEVADVGEPHSVSMAVAAGADVVNPFMALNWLEREANAGYLTKVDGSGSVIVISASEAVANYRKAMNAAFAKIRSKMGAPDVGSYTGSNFFAFVGIHKHVAEKYFPGVESRISGPGLDHFDAQARQLRMIGDRASDLTLPQFGIYRDHTPAEERDVIAETHYPPVGWPQAVQKAVVELGAKDFEGGYQRYKEVVSQRPQSPVNPRDLMEIQTGRDPIAVEEVMPVDDVIRQLLQFGHASFGSLSSTFKNHMAQAAETLGITSGTGEGGIPQLDGHVSDDDVQIASARFGADVRALANAKHITIKVSQGAKPGIGGELPGIKVAGLVALTRNVPAGTTLISPPNHFGLHSIEDLGLLIRVLKKVSGAEVTVKITSGAGVEAVAAGIAKGGADIHLSGYNGGTGASPISATHQSGYPWEFSTATVANHLRKLGLSPMASLQVDGSIYAPFDAFVAVLMGADKVGLMTLPMIFAGCDKQDDCHSGNCDKGIATNKPDVMAKYKGSPDDIVRGVRYFAQQFREMMAEHGFRTLDEMRGQTGCLQQIKTDDPVWGIFDFSGILPAMSEPPAYAAHIQRGEFVTAPNVPTANENRIMAKFMEAYGRGAERIVIEALQLQNDDIGFMTQLSGAMARLQKQYPNTPLPKVEIHSTGIAGEYAAFALHPNVTWIHEGFTNDGTAEVNSGGLIVVKAPANVQPGTALVGNTSCYGQTKGVVLVGGACGTRTAPRFSGGVLVVEGVGDNSFEFTTGGLGVVAGKVGRNFGAGSYGGVIAVINANPDATVANADRRTFKVLGPDGREFDSNVQKQPALLTGDKLALTLGLVKASLAGHARLTDSPTTRQILENWEGITQGDSPEKLLLMVPSPPTVDLQMKSVAAALSSKCLLEPV